MLRRGRGGSRTNVNHTPVEDRFGHRISYLRISITDRCNERCRYCLPEERQEWLPRDGILSYEEILRILRIGAVMGIRKVRITAMHAPRIRGDDAVYAVFIRANLDTAHLSHRGAIRLVSG